MICTYLECTDNKKIDKKLSSKPNILDNDKLNEEIHKEVHKNLSIFNSKINKTAKHEFQTEEYIKNKTYQIENNLEEVINNKTYEIYKDLSKQLNEIYNETIAYCETTRIEETSLEISLSVELHKLQVDLLWLRNETLGECLNLTNITNNLKKEMYEGLV